MPRTIDSSPASTKGVARLHHSTINNQPAPPQQLSPSTMTRSAPRSTCGGTIGRASAPAVVAAPVRGGRFLECAVLAATLQMPNRPTRSRVPLALRQSPVTNHQSLLSRRPVHLPLTAGVLEFDGTSMTPKTLYQKIWDSHVVREDPGQPSIIYIDRHLIHEGTSPQAFAGLRAEGRKVRRPDLTFAVMDHSVPTVSKQRLLPIVDTDARLQFEALAKNCAESGVRLFDMNSQHQGIVHIIG